MIKIDIIRNSKPFKNFLEIEKNLEFMGSQLQQQNNSSKNNNTSYNLPL